MTQLSLQNNKTVSHWILLSLLFLLGLAVFSHGLSAEFRWDDYTLIVDNPNIASWNNLHTIFLKPLSPSFTNYYRPLQELSYKIDYLFFNLNPFGYHLHSLLIHIANVFLFYFLLLLLSDRRSIAFVSAAIFCLHPIAAEPVNYIASRTDLLLAFFSLLCTFLYLTFKKTNNKKLLILSLLSFVFALLSKEAAITLPFLLLIYEKLLGHRTKQTLPFFLLLASYLIIRKITIPHNALPIFVSGLLTTYPKTFFLYVKSLLLPLNLVKTWYVKPIGLITFKNFFLPLIGILCFLLVLIKSYFKSKKACFGLLWFALSIIPFLFLSYPQSQMPAFSYAWAYWPSIGFIFGCVFYLNLGRPKHYAPFFILLPFFIFFFLSSTQTTSIWSMKTIEFDHFLLEHHPGSNLIKTDLGLTYLREKDLNNAEIIFSEMLDKNPNSEVALLSLGNIALEKNQLNTASHYYQKLIKTYPEKPAGYYNMGQINLRQGNNALAFALFKHVLKLDSQHQDARHNLAVLINQN